MSEWPGTCGISRCIIDQDEKARLIVLIENDGKAHIHGGGFTNVVSNWVPVMFPLTGSYDGWGKIVDIEVDNDANSHYMLEFFNYQLQNKKLVIEDMEDYCPNEMFESVEKLVEAIERDAVRFKSIYTGKLVRVSFMLVLEDMYTKALELMKEGNESCHCPFKRIQNILTGGYGDQCDQTMENAYAKAMNQEPRKVSLLINYLWSRDGYHYFSESSKYNATESTEQLAKEAIIFRSFLDRTRQSFAPQIAGGDDFTYGIHLMWNKESGKIMKAYKKKQDKKYSE